MSIDIAELLAPISADAPCGEDLSFDEVFDQIREARRADDPSLSQGEWQTELKVADWRQVIGLGSEVMIGRSKDLQLAAWMGEALIAREGMAGATQAFALINGLLETYWDSLFPVVEEDDMDERAGRLAWFNNYASAALNAAPLSAGANGVTLASWQQSRDMDNLARQNAEAYQNALDEGRMTGDAFDKAMTDSSDDHVRSLLADAQAAQAAFAACKTTVDARMGRDAPSLALIETALKRIVQIAQVAAEAKGLLSAGEVHADADADAPSGASGASAPGASPGAGKLDLSADTAASKKAALRALADIAAFFKRTEPHSPVAYLLDRAVAWADMPLSQWLAEVIRDDSTLSSLRDRIGIKE